MKRLLCVVVFVGAIAGGWAIASRPSACEELHAICSRPSISNLNAAMVCGFSGVMLYGNQMKERKCARILAQVKK